MHLREITTCKVALFRSADNDTGDEDLKWADALV